MKVYKGERRIEFFYVISQMTVNDEVKHHVCIFEKGKEEVHPFSSYFKDKIGVYSLKNKSLNTLTNFHLTFIIRFLNYVFNDAVDPIDKIEDLTLRLVEDFLDAFSQGKLPGDNLGRWRNKDTVVRANYAISHFVYWLWWKKIPNTSKKMFKMKNFTSSSFDFYTKTRKDKYDNSTAYKKLANLVIPDTTKKQHKRRTSMRPTKYAISKLIEIASDHDYMITFAIVLGAYAGLRLGDICQMYEGRMNGFEDDNDFGAYLDFTYETILRSDNIITSHCKTKREIPIYEGCTSAIYDYYKEHIAYLKSQGLYPNKYGAIFIDNNGHAMTDRTFQRRFEKIVSRYELATIHEASMGSIDAKNEKSLFSEGKITIQSLRRYYKQLIEIMEDGNVRKIQYYMTHKREETQSEYGISRTTIENIRRCQNEIYRPIKGE